MGTGFEIKQPDAADMERINIRREVAQFTSYANAVMEEIESGYLSFADAAKVLQGYTSRFKLVNIDVLLNEGGNKPDITIVIQVNKTQSA